MREEVFLQRSRIPAPAEEVFRWHARPGALERLAPPWQEIEVLSRSGGIEDGARVDLSLKRGPFRVRWTARHDGYEEGRRFRDTQIRGPFASWSHTHTFLPEGRECILEDRVEYRLPFDLAGRWVASRAVRRELRRTFAYRHRVTHDDLALPVDAPLRILVTGAGGLIGGALIPFLTTRGHRVTRLMRTGNGPTPTRSGSGPAPTRSEGGASPHDAGLAGTLAWNPESGFSEPAALEDFDAVIHLAAENIGRRWTASRRRRILRSRAEGTRRLGEALARLQSPPRVLLQASAVGYYGDRGEETLTEDSPGGGGFLAEVTRAWEAAGQEAASAGIRVVALRLGVVLSPRGGALARMLPVFRLGLGGRLGNGRQILSWISMEDVLGAALHAMRDERVRGPVNVTSPRSATQAEFSSVLARVLKRPALFPVPAVALRLAFGAMARETILTSQNARPARLLDAGYTFRHPDLEEALRHCLGRTETEEAS